MKTMFRRKEQLPARPVHANYSARTKFEATLHLEELIRTVITSLFLLKSTPTQTIIRVYLPSCDALQVVEAIQMINTTQNEKKH